MMLNKTFYLLLLSLIPLLGFSQANSQYPDSGNKIRLGFQTTGDGLIWRDTQPKVGGYQPINNKAAWIILDTINNKFYHYKNSTWTLAGGQDIDTANLIATKYDLGFKLSLADTQNMLTPYWRSGRFSGVLPVANGGTGLATFTAANRIPYSTSETALSTSANLTFDGTKLILLGNQSFTGTQSFVNNEINSTYTQTTATNAGVVGAFNSLLTYAGTSAFSNSRAYSVVPNVTNTNTNNLISGAYYSIRTGSSGAANALNSLLTEYRISGSGNVTDAKIVSGLIFKDGAGTLTNAFGLKIEDITNTAGTITNTYAIHIGDITSGTQTTKAYSLFISDQNSRSYINSNTGLGVLDPTARLHLANGTATAGTAPLKFTSGTALTTPEVGAMEFSNISGTNRLLISPADNVRKEIAYTDFSNTTGVLPVANGGTGENMSGLPNNYLIRKNSSGIFDTSIVYEANGRVGIGTNNPTSILDLASSGSSLNFSARLFRDATTGPSFTFIKNRGTLENPLPVQNGDNMGELNFSGAALIRGFNSLAPGANFLNGGLRIQITSEIDQGSALRFVIISNGFTGIGVTVPTERLHVGGNGLFTGSITTNSLTTNGIVYSNAGTLTNTNPSDSTLKNSINSYTYGLSEILQLKPKTFYYNLDVTRSHLKYGFIAQEVQPIMPDLVRIIGNGSDKLGLESEGIYVAMVNAIKELSAEIDILKQEIINLKNK